MKKFIITTLLILVTIVNSGILLIPANVLAQVDPNEGVNLGTPTLTNEEAIRLGEAAASETNSTAATRSALAELDASDAVKERLAQQQAIAGKSDPDTAKVTACSPWLNFLTTRCWGTLMISLAGLIVKIGGVFLNFSIDVSVLKMSGIVKDLGAINAAWKVFRDLANMFFIFILIYIAISTILGAASGQTRKMLVSVILVALFINFSLFATKVVIDASNIVTVQFYNSIATGGNSADNGLSQVFMNASHFTTLFQDVTPDKLSETNFLLIGFMSLIFSIMLAICFIAIGVLFLIRFVTFIILMILSPLAFLGLTLPALSGSFDKWRKALTDQAIFAPFMMAMLWVVAAIINSNGFMVALQVKNPSVTWANAFGAHPGGAIYVIVNFAILIIMLIAGMAISKQWAGKGGDSVIGMADKWSRKVVNAPTIPFRATARYGVGAASTGLGKLWDAGAARVRESGFAKSGGGKFIATAANITGLSAIPRSARETLAAGENVKFGLGTTHKGRVEEDKKRAVDVTQIRREQKNEETIDKSLGVLANAATTPAEKDTARRELQKVVSSLGDKEIEAQKTSRLTNQEFMQTLSTRQIEFLKKSDKKSEKEKEDIMAARQKPIKDAVDVLKNVASTPDQREKAEKLLRAVNDKELELLSAELLEDPALLETITQSQIDGLIKSTNITKSQKDAIKEESIRPTLVNLGLLGTRPPRAGDPPPNPAAAAAKIRRMKPKDVGKLDSDILTHSDIIDTYTSGMLAKMAEEMNSDKIDRVRTAIESLHTRLSLSGRPVPQNIKDLKTWLDSPLGSVFS